MKKPEGEVLPGRYQHFKGGEYEVYGVARHSECEEEFVIYRPLYGAGLLLARPLGMFLERVAVNDILVPRFRYLGPTTTNTPTIPQARPG